MVGEIRNPFVVIGAYEPCACCIPFRADFYRGCRHNCVYCYAHHIYDTYNQDWKQFVTTTKKAIEKRFHLAFEEKRPGKLNELMRKRTPFRCGVMTENFPKEEEKYRLAETFLKKILEYDYPSVFNTKSTLPSKQPYLGLFSEAAKRELVVVQMTLISLDEKLVRKIEPGAPTPQERLETLKVLSENGVPTHIRLSPFIPQITTDYRELAEEARKAGVRAFLTEYLRISPPMGVEASTKKEFYSNKLLYEATGIDLWAEYEKDGGKCYDGYMRYPVDKKFQFYWEFKRIVEGLGMDLYVCSEENPAINDRPNACANCCGTDYFRSFDSYNTATFNNLYRLLMGKDEVTFQDFKNMEDYLYISDQEKRPLKYNSVDEERLLNFWDKRGFSKILKNVKAKKAKTRDDHLIYTLTRPSLQES